MSQFIITHKQFDLPIKNKEDYTVLCPKGTTIENWPNIIYFESDLDNRVWSEISAMIWIRQHVKSDWVTINHYRRLLDTYDGHCLVAEPFIFPCNIAQQYENFHNLKDLDDCSSIIKQAYPNLYPIWLQTLQSNVFYPYNMVSLPKKLYDELVDVISSILLTLMKGRKLDDYDATKQYIETNAIYTTNNGSRITDVAYQTRLPSFLAERLTTWYINCAIAKGAVIFPAAVKKYENAF